MNVKEQLDVGVGPGFVGGVKSGVAMLDFYRFMVLN